MLGSHLSASVGPIDLCCTARNTVLKHVSSLMSNTISNTRQAFASTSADIESKC